MARPGVAAKLLKGVPYSEKELQKKKHYELWVIAKFLGVPRNEQGKYGKKQEVIAGILEVQKTLKKFDARIEPFCEMCGRHNAFREEAHIIAEWELDWWNNLKLCPTCHRMFDIHLKPRLFAALEVHGAKGLPKSWASPFGNRKNGLTELDM
jgi:hypothetical protein